MSAPESTHKPSPFPWRDAGEFSSAIIDANGDYVSQQIEEITVADYDRILVCVNACAGMDDPAKEIEAAEREAVTLAKSMHRRHYAESAPQWESLSDVPGIISQIDNMHAGVCQQLDAAKFENQVMREAIKAAHEHLSYAQGKHRILTRNRVVKALAKLEPFIKP